MKKCAIATINSSNYGNRLQNYALQEFLLKMNVSCVTIKNISLLNNKKNNLEYVLRNLKHIYKRKDFVDKKEREKYFIEFNKKINFTKSTFNWFNLKKIKNYDYYITGSDQVWNPKNRMSGFDLLSFAPAEKRIAYAASIAIEKIPLEYEEIFRNEVSKFKSVSLREEAGKKITQKLTGRSDVEVLIDPTMLLSASEWENVAKKPSQLNDEKYILCYFLGNLSDSKRKAIKKIADEKKLKVINILDKDDPFYETGPSEFLYLEKNAEIICTDSFHSSVFAILFNRPFIIFEREGFVTSMNSRLDTLISKFNLKNRRFNGERITEENLNHDYTEAYKILETERDKSRKFLEKALDIEDNK